MEFVSLEAIFGEEFPINNKKYLKQCLFLKIQVAIYAF